jgi:hypothetical protein
MMEVQKIKQKKIYSNPSMFFQINNEEQPENFVSYAEAFRNVKDFNERKPFVLADISFNPIFDRPNFYDLKCEDKNAAFELGGMRPWGVFYNDTLYLNSLRLGMSGDYVKIIEFGTYSYFKSEPIKSREDHDRINNMSLMFGLAGGIATAARIYNKNKNNIHYIVNLNGGGNPHLLNQYYVEYLLQDYTDLLPQFKSEPKPDELETQLKYVRLLNKR